MTISVLILSHGASPMTVFKKYLFSASSASLRHGGDGVYYRYQKIFVKLHNNGMAFNSTIDCLTMRTFSMFCMQLASLIDSAIQTGLCMLR